MRTEAIITSAADLCEALVDFATYPSGGAVSPFYRLAVMNWLGCALSGSSAGTVDLAVGVHAGDGAGAARPIGRQERLSLSATVMVDCLSSAAQAYDDIHFATTLHPTGPVAAAIFGLARTRQVPGASALEALRLGMEVECRLSRLMMGPDTGAAPGWYPTGIAGGLGAAAATGWLLGLDRDRMRHAFGLAAARASGTRGTHGGMSAFYVPALAAEAGYIAARLAEAGFTSGPGALCGPLGLIPQIAPNPAVAAAAADLGRVFQGEATACKPYPYGFISFALIDCCTQLAQQVPDTGAITEVRIEVSPVAARLGSNPAPRTMFEAQVSLPFIAAVTLGDPAAVRVPVPEDFRMTPAQGALMARIKVQAADDLADYQARAVLLTRMGRQVSVRCDVAPASPGRLPSPAELQAKFLDLASPVIGAKRAEQALEALMAIEDCADVALFLDQLRPV